MYFLFYRISRVLFLSWVMLIAICTYYWENPEKIMEISGQTKRIPCADLGVYDKVIFMRQ